MSYTPPGPRETNGTAIAALVCSLVFAPLGIVLGHIARGQIRRSGEGGRGLATAALIIGYLFTIGSVIAVVTTLIFVNAIDDGGNVDQRHHGSGAIEATLPETAPTTAASSLAGITVRVFGAPRESVETVMSRLQDAGADVSESGTATVDVSMTTVFFGDTSGERAAAEHVAAVLDAPVMPRPSDLMHQPPGVVVAVTG
jgi:hypothetical protein